MAEEENDFASYWPLQEADDLIRECMLRRKRYLDHLLQTGILSRIRRNWHFFYNLYNGYEDAGAIKQAGDEGELSIMSISEFRSVLSLLKTYIIGSRPEFDTLAYHYSSEGMESAKLGNTILDNEIADQFKGLESALEQAVEDALILSEGYIWDPWFDHLGEVVEGDEETGELIHEGDLLYDNPTILDVVYDDTIRKWENHNWVLVQRSENRYELAAQFPKKAADILAASRSEDDYQYQLYQIESLIRPRTDNDHVDVFYFYHRPTMAVSEGRFVRFVGSTVLEDRPLNERHLPVHRLVPADWQGIGHGYTPAYDIQGPQEAMNAVASTILTNQDTLGSQKVWFQAGETINKASLESGISVLQTQTKPEVLQLLKTPQELFKALELYQSYIERLSGVNAVSRGQPEAPSASGAALALIESRTIQAASSLVTNYARFVSRVGTSILWTLKHMATTKRMVSFVGEDEKRHLIKYDSDKLQPIDKVLVIQGNPALRTLSGRVGLAQALLQSGLLTDPQQFVNVVMTGKLKGLTSAVEAQLRTAQAENEAVLRGEDPGPPMMTDDHVSHILRMSAILDTPEVRRDPERAPLAMAHIAAHVQFLQDPYVIQLMMMLGYRINPLANPQQQAPAPPGQENIEGMTPPPGKKEIGTGNSPPRLTGMPEDVKAVVQPTLDQASGA